MMTQTLLLKSILLLLVFVGATSCATRQSYVSRQVMTSNSEPELEATTSNPPVLDTRKYMGLRKDRKAAPPHAAKAARAQHFDWPVRLARLTRGFIEGNRRKGRRPHWGLDLAASRGTPILAAQEGIVIYAGRDFSGYGNMILLENGFGWATLYAHLDRFHVREGERIRQGQVLGTMGRTGRATGVHLHFEIRKHRDPLDPLPLLPAGTELVAKYNR